MIKLPLTSSSIGDGICCKRGYRRKKQPEQVRAALIHSAAEIAAMQGLSGVTVQAVAAAAGVTKGGFFHHFPHKQSLLEAVLETILVESDEKIDRLMAADPQVQGSFTRAYITLAFEDILGNEDSLRVKLSLSMMSSPDLCQRWNSWLGERLIRHRLTDGQPEYEMARLAADGAWLTFSLGAQSAVRDPLALKQHLLQLTRESDPL